MESAVARRTAVAETNRAVVAFGTHMATEDNDAEVIGQGRFLRLMKRKDNGWEYVARSRVKGIVGVVLVTDAQELVLISHFNPPFQRGSIELPAGLAGDVEGKEGESLPEAASRELLEETGYTAEKLEFLAVATTSPGLCTEIVNLYRARGVKRVAEGGGVDNENITVHHVPLASARQWLADKVREGNIVDMKIYAALGFAQG